jgi:hypothetical protein
MGDIVKSTKDPMLVINVKGTAPIKQVDIVRNNVYIHRAAPPKQLTTKDFEINYSDSLQTPGDRYYYVRVEQTDGQLAWSSPIWVTYQK